MEEGDVQDALMTTLAHLARRLDESRDPATLLAALADGARGLLPFTACALALPRPWRVWRATAARPNEVVLNERIPQEAERTLERFIEHGQLLRIDDLLAPPWNDATHRDVLWKDGTRSAILVPLRRGASTIGGLSFTSTQPDRYPVTHRETVALLAWMSVATMRLFPDHEAEA